MELLEIAPHLDPTMLDHQATKLYRFSVGDMSVVYMAPPLFRRYSPLAYVARQDLGEAQ